MSERYDIEDCIYYDTTTYTATSSTKNYEFFKSLPSGDCSISWEEQVTTADSCFIRVGVDNIRNFVNVGIINSNGIKERVWTYDNGSYIEQKDTGRTITTNQWVTKELTIVEGVLTYQGTSATTSKTFNYSYLVSLYHKYSTVKNFKIKPL